MSSESVSSLSGSLWRFLQTQSMYTFKSRQQNLHMSPRHFPLPWTLHQSNVIHAVECQLTECLQSNNCALALLVGVQLPITNPCRGDRLDGQYTSHERWQTASQGGNVMLQIPEMYNRNQLPHLTNSKSPRTARCPPPLPRGRGLSCF